MDYRPRICDQELAYLVGNLPAVSVEGAKGVGKTASALRLAATTFRLDDPDQLAAIQANRHLVLDVPTPLLVDEWQNDPPIWDAVRRAVDDDGSAGRFVLTGSAYPRHAKIHSGAGRFVRLRMRPLSFAERGLENPTVSLGALWRGEHPAIHGETAVTTREYAREIVDSGLPGIRFASADLRHRLLSDYLDQVVEHDLSELGVPLRRPAALRAWLRAYAGATATTASYEAIARAHPDGDGLSRSTILAYRDALDQLWLLDELPAYIGLSNGLRRLGTAPKHHLADPALAALLLQVDADGLTFATDDTRPAGLRNGPLLGALFESLVTLSVRVYARAADRRIELSHLRTSRGDHEVDLVLASAGRGVLAIEVKFAAAPDDRDVRHLNWLAGQLGDDLVDRVLVTAGPYAYRRPDGVAVVPLALLGP
jgi:predicted AAA+ superfamily ATPase